MSKKKDTVSVIVRPSRGLVNRLNALAEKYERESANQIIVEIVQLYTDAWVELEEAHRRNHKQQWERMKEMLRLPMLPQEAETEPETKPTAHGRKR